MQLDGETEILLVRGGNAEFTDSAFYQKPDNRPSFELKSLVWFIL